MKLKEKITKAKEKAHDWIIDNKDALLLGLGYAMGTAMTIGSAYLYDRFVLSDKFGSDCFCNKNEETGEVIDAGFKTYSLNRFGKKVENTERIYSWAPKDAEDVGRVLIDAAKGNVDSEGWIKLD